MVVRHYAKRCFAPSITTSLSLLATSNALLRANYKSKWYRLIERMKIRRLNRCIVRLCFQIWQGKKNFFDSSYANAFLDLKAYNWIRRLRSAHFCRDYKTSLIVFPSPTSSASNAPFDRWVKCFIYLISLGLPPQQRLRASFQTGLTEQSVLSVHRQRVWIVRQVHGQL